MSTICTLDHIKNKHNLYRGEDTTNIIHFEKNNVTVNKKITKITSRFNVMLHLSKKLYKNIVKDKNHHKVRDHCYDTGKYKGAAHGICNLRFKIPSKILVVFPKDSNTDLYFVIKELEKAF